MDGSGCYVVLIFNHPPLGLDRCKDGFQLIQVVTKLYPLFGGHVYSLAIERVTEIHHPKKGTRRIARVFSLFGASLVFELFSVFWAWKFWEIWFGNCETKTRTRKRNWVVKNFVLCLFLVWIQRVQQRQILDPTSGMFHCQAVPDLQNRINYFCWIRILRKSQFWQILYASQHFWAVWNEDKPEAWIESPGA